jgi:hexosaminidase
MKHLHFGTSKGIFATATGALALGTMLVMSLPSAFGSSQSRTLTSDRSATGRCTTTFTGTHNGVISVTSGTTCLVNLHQIGAVNVTGAGLSVTRGSNINGAITLVAATAFTFCGSKTTGGAINSTTASGFILIGNGGDGGLLVAPCNANTIDGAVTLSGNLGGVEIGGNSLLAALTVSNNIAPSLGVPLEDHATEIEANTVKGLTTCAGNVPAPTNDGRKNTFTGSAGGQCATL